MKGDAKLIEMLNGLLADEFAAVHQYAAHAGTARNWGYKRFAEYVEKRGAQEAEHAAELIDRILFLGGAPTVTRLSKIAVGPDLLAGLGFDRAAEDLAVRNYNAAVAAAVAVNDEGSATLLRHILTEEDEHLLAIEQLITQAEQMGTENWLAGQV